MAETERDEIRRICIVGAGVIGAGWTKRCLAQGLDVIATDPAPGAEERLRASVDNAWPVLERVGLHPEASKGRLNFTSDLETAVAGADFVQENGPERENVKKQLISRIDNYASPEVIIASSSSGLLPTKIQGDCFHPERVVVGHPFNPVYLLPLVEVVGGAESSPKTIRKAMDFYRKLDMRPLHVRKEVEGHISDRLQEALWRENLHMVAEGVATTQELDDAIVYGPGLRWALMGVNLTFHIAGGEGGMTHFLQRVGPGLNLPWTKLEPPEETDELIERLVQGTSRQAANRSVAELECRRDEFLIRLLELVREYWSDEGDRNGGGNGVG